VKLDDLNLCEKSLEKDDFMCCFDLSNMYFHVKLHKFFSRYFNFSIPNTDGVSEYYRFQVMCYGYSQAGRIVTRLIAPLKAFLHMLGIRLHIYLDDGRICGQLFYECYYKTQLTLLVFQLAGWNIQWKKTSTTPLQRLNYQGFITDTTTMKYSVNPEKQACIILQIEEVLAGPRTIKTLELASILGKIASLQRSHGKLVNIMTRISQNLLGTAIFTNLGNWDGDVTLTAESITELSFLAKHLPSQNGKFIPTNKSSNKTFEHLEVDAAIAQVKLTEDDMTNLLVSDASDTRAYAYAANNNIELIEDHKFDEFERSLSSSQREMRAALVVLKKRGQELKRLKHRIIYWQTDSKNFESFLRRGSKLQHIQLDVLQIKLLEHELGIELVAVWTPREHPRIFLADQGSKHELSTDEWGLERPMLNSLLEAFNFIPTVDAFASSENTICEKFFARFPQIGATVNFFAHQPEEGQAYFMCPPTNYILDAIYHIEQAQVNCEALLIVPVWYRSFFWAALHTGRSWRPSIKKFVFFEPRFTTFNNAPCVFAKTPHFLMVALLVRPNV